MAMPADNDAPLSGEQREQLLKRLATGFYRSEEVTRFVARCLSATFLPVPPINPEAKGEETNDGDV